MTCRHIPNTHFFIKEDIHIRYIKIEFLDEIYWNIYDVQNEYAYPQYTFLQ